MLPHNLFIVLINKGIFILFGFYLSQIKIDEWADINDKRKVEIKKKSSGWELFFSKLLKIYFLRVSFFTRLMRPSGILSKRIFWPSK